MELPNFTKKESELTSGFDRWMYVLKHLANLQDLPEALRNRVFEKLCRVSEIAKMTPIERKSYDQSLKEYRDMYLMENALKKKETQLQKKETQLQKIETQLQKTETQLQEIEAIVKRQNRALKKKDETMVRVLLDAGISVEKISESTGLSLTEIQRIKKTL